MNTQLLFFCFRFISWGCYWFWWFEIIIAHHFEWCCVFILMACKCRLHFFFCCLEWMMEVKAGRVVTLSFSRRSEQSREPSTQSSAKTAYKCLKMFLWVNISFLAVGMEEVLVYWRSKIFDLYFVLLNLVIDCCVPFLLSIYSQFALLMYI